MRIHWRHPLGLCQLILILSCYLLSMLFGGYLFTLHFDDGFLLCDTPLPDKLFFALLLFLHTALKKIINRSGPVSLVVPLLCNICILICLIYSIHLGSL